VPGSAKHFGTRGGRKSSEKSAARKNEGSLLKSISGFKNPEGTWSGA